MLYSFNDVFKEVFFLSAKLMWFLPARLSQQSMVPALWYCGSEACSQMNTLTFL